MDDGVDAVERTLEGSGVAHVAHDQLDLGLEVIGALAGGVHLLAERVERTDLVSESEQVTSDVRADEPRASRDEDPFRHAHPI